MDFMLKRHSMKELIMQLQLIKYMLLNVDIFALYFYAEYNFRTLISLAFLIIYLSASCNLVM